MDLENVQSRPIFTTSATRRIGRFVARKINLDLLTGRFLLVLVIVYIISYGLINLKGFHFGRFVLAYGVIIVPIWIVDGLKSFLESFLARDYKHAAEDLNKVEAIIACKNGEPFINKTIDDLKKRLSLQQIILVSNGSTDKTAAIARKAGVRCLEYVEPLGKVRAINQALRHLTRPYVLLLDDDTFIGEAPLPTGLLDDGYEGVAFRVQVKKTNWLSQLQAYEYRKSCDVGKRYHNKKASVQNISGAVGLFKREVLIRQTKIHNCEFSGEDLQRTLLIHLRNKSKGVVLANSVVVTEVPSTISSLFKQRVFGWFPGLYANFFNYLKILTRDYMPGALRFDAFYNCFLVMVLDALRLLSLPILIFYPWYFVVMYGVYVLLESVTFIKSGHHEPIWVLLIYPIYGLFGFITRICAFAVFIYRRLVAKLANLKFFDDYRLVKGSIKSVSVIVVMGFLASALLLNIIFNVGRQIISFHF